MSDKQTVNKDLISAVSRMITEDPDVFSEAIKDKDVMRASYIAKSAPSTHEIGWLGHKKYKGTKDRVQVKFDPSDEKIKDQYMYHTHPVQGDANPLFAMPSGQDLLSAIEVTAKGLKGIVVFAKPYYTIIVPTQKVNEKPNFKRYETSLSNGDIEDAVKEIEKLGFDIETGKF